MNNIRELMERACMQQKQLAAMCKVSGPTISDWVNNKKNPSGKNLKRLEEVFGVSSGVILGYDPVPIGERKTNAQQFTEQDETWAIRERLRRDPGKKKEAPESGLDDRLVDMLVSLSPDQVQRVMDFVAGMKAADKA